MEGVFGRYRSTGRTYSVSSLPSLPEAEIPLPEATPAPVQLPPPPCSISDGHIACGDAPGSGATHPIFKRYRSAHIMSRWLPAASISCRSACISQCFGGWSAGLYAVWRRELELPGTSPVVEDPLQSQQPPSDALRSHGVTWRQRRSIRCASST